MKILITHYYSKRNRGDMAILSVMLQLLNKKYPASNIGVLTADKISKNTSLDGADFILNSYLYFCIYKSKNFLSRILNVFYVLAITLLWASIYKFLKINTSILMPAQIRKTSNSFLNADLIVPVGGGYLRGSKSIQSNLTLIIQLHSILISIILGKKIILYSQSIGPFENVFQKLITKIILNMVDAIFVRENNTLRTLKSIGVKNKLIYKTVDAAFGFKTNTKNKMKKELSGMGINSFDNLIGITVREWLPDDKQLIFENEIAEFVKYLVNNKKKIVVFIPQVDSSFHNDNDRKVNERIVFKLKNLKNVYIINKNYSHTEIKGIYENLHFLIGTRMHSVIFALTGYVPSIAIEYEYKTNGMMKDLGLKEWVINIEKVNSDILIAIYNKIVISRSSYLKILNVSIPKVRKNVDFAVEYLNKVYLAKKL